ncbi:hypothetical protein [uncultured Thomasclavelia sp.]|nr:hypothetical protein [uncultured Thomasclavelia sp.]
MTGNIDFNQSLLKAAQAMNKLIATDVQVLNQIDDTYNQDFLELLTFYF